MPDYVPTTGAWQTDPQLQQLITAYVNAQADTRIPDIRARGRAEGAALKQYVDANRRRLGIPDNYYPDTRTLTPQRGGQQNGQALRDPRQNQWRNLGLIAGALAVPAVAAIAAPGAGAAAATAPEIAVSTSALPSGLALPTATGAVTGGAGTGMGYFSTIGNFLGSQAGQQAISTGGNLLGGYLQSRSQDRASDQQAQAAREALQFEKDVYGKDVADYDAGLGSLGGQTTQRLGDLLSQRHTTQTAADVFGNGQLPPGSMTLSQMRQAPAPQATVKPSGGITIQAPDGSRQMVRADAVQKYLAKGGQVVN